MLPHIKLRYSCFHPACVILAHAIQLIRSRYLQTPDGLLSRATRIEHERGSATSSARFRKCWNVTWARRASYACFTFTLQSNVILGRESEELGMGWQGSHRDLSCTWPPKRAVNSNYKHIYKIHEFD